MYWLWFIYMINLSCRQKGKQQQKQANMISSVLAAFYYCWWFMSKCITRWWNCCVNSCSISVLISNGNIESLFLLSFAQSHPYFCLCFWTWFDPPFIHTHIHSFPNHHANKSNHSQAIFSLDRLFSDPSGYGGDSEQFAATAGPGSMEGAEHRWSTESCHHAAGHGGAGGLCPRRQPAEDGYRSREHREHPWV